MLDYTEHWNIKKKWINKIDIVIVYYIVTIRLVIAIL